MLNSAEHKILTANKYENANSQKFMLSWVEHEKRFYNLETRQFAFFAIFLLSKMHGGYQTVQMHSFDHNLCLSFKRSAPYIVYVLKFRIMKRPWRPVCNWCNIMEV